MIKTPFRMHVVNEMQQWRHDTWATKEPETIAWIDSFKPPAIFYDIGANIGIYSLYCAEAHPEIDVFAFEPHPANFNSLMANKALNQYQNLHGMMAAVTHTTRLCMFKAPFATAGSTGGQIVESQDWPVVVPGYAIDDYVAHKRPSPDHIKIDIDGVELDVLRGMTHTLKTLTSMLIEVRGDTAAPVQAIMARAGFTTANRFNTMTPHSRERRYREGIPDENIVYTRRTP